MGHYVADGSQPLHVTRDYDGWVEKDNPNGYNTQHGIHSKFETTFVSANLTAADVQPLMTPVHPVSDEWDAYLAYLRHTDRLRSACISLTKNMASMARALRRGSSLRRSGWLLGRACFAI